MDVLFALARQLGTAALIMVCAAAWCGFVESHSEILLKLIQKFYRGGRDK